MGTMASQESRLRRIAERKGLKLVKSRRRDPRANDYGSYMLVDGHTGNLVADFGWDHPSIGNHLAEVEEYLTRMTERAAVAEIEDIAADPDRDPAVAHAYECPFCAAKPGQSCETPDGLPHYTRTPR